MRRKANILLKALLGIAFIAPFAGVDKAYAEDESQAVTAEIVCATPSVDKQLSVTVEGTENYYVNWFVDGYQKSTANTYTPSTSDYEKLIKVKVISTANGTTIAEDTMWFSKLPVVYIDTADGTKIVDKTEKTAHITIQGNGSYKSQYDGESTVKLRGNSSTQYTQKPYKVKLDKSTNLFGMGKSKHWCLIPNFLDQSGLRNMLASSIAKQLEVPQMDMVYVDVVLNGEYVGFYELVEHIRIDKNRIEIYNWEDEAKNVAKSVYNAYKDASEGALTSDDCDAIEDMLCADMAWITSGAFTYKEKSYTINDYYLVNEDITGGYLFELSDEFDEVSKFETNNKMKVMVKSPEYLSTNSEMFSYAKKYWNDFEEAIMSANGYNSADKHYTELADLNSMVGYWLTNEFMGNDDAHYKSRYAYKDLNGKLVFGPVWDFDWGCASATTNNDANILRVSFGSLWKDFINDPYFITKAAELYWDNYDYICGIVADGGYIDSAIEYTKEAGQKNDVVYDDRYVFGSERRTYDTDAAIFKQYMKERIQFFDKLFGDEEYFDKLIGIDPEVLYGKAYDLSSYNQKDILKFYEEYNLYPYLRNKSGMPITLVNAKKDTVSEHIKADGIIANNKNLEVSVNADANTKYIEVYVNGLKLDDAAYTFEIAENNAAYVTTFTVNASRLTEKMGDKNVISIIGKDATDEITYKNYATVIVEPAEVVAGTPYVMNDGNIEYDVTVPHVMINQVYGAGSKLDGYVSHDFIELYNPTDKDIDLSNWSVAYRSSADGSQSDAWISHKLTGTIKAHSSYLIRCANNTKKVENAYDIIYFDEEWSDLVIHNKGISVVLMSDASSISSQDVIYDNEAKKPTSNSFVDLYAVNGNDDKAKQQVSYFEGKAEAEQSKKNTVRRTKLIDTDNNASDMQSVDYSFANEAYIAYIAPKTSCHDGAWYYDENDYPTYKVTFDTNGGSSVETQYVRYTKKISAPKNPTREGYEFEGWFADDKYTVEFDFDVKYTADVTVYAKWKINTYVVTWIDATGKTLKTENVDYLGSGTNPSAPEVNGYEFTGWSAPATAVKSNMTIKPVYTKITLTVKTESYKLNANKKATKKTVTTTANVGANKASSNQTITLCTKQYNSAVIKASVTGKKTNISYTSSNKSVATVTSTGKIVAKKAGQTTITVNVKGCITKIKVVVKNPLISVKVGKKVVGKSITLKKKATAKLSVSKFVTSKTTFKSSNSNIVSVSKTGKLAAKKKGIAYITISVAGQSKKIKVSVK